MLVIMLLNFIRIVVLTAFASRRRLCTGAVEAAVGMRV